MISTTEEFSRLNEKSALHAIQMELQQGYGLSPRFRVESRCEGLLSGSCNESMPLEPAVSLVRQPPTLIPRVTGSRV